MQIEFGGEALILRSDKTLFWPGDRTLFAADLHFGKLAHFRKNGSGIPEAGATTVIHQLENALLETKATRLIILGDFFHSVENMAMLDIAQNWKFDVETWLIPGNHDLLKLSDYQSLGFQIYPDYQKCGPFLLTHIPPEKPDLGRFFLSGHVHPSVRVKGKAKQTMRLPCFFKSSEQLILPAMGIFTGTFTLRQNKPEDRAYAIAGNAIFEMENF